MTYRDNIDKLARRITDRIPAKVKKLSETDPEYECLNEILMMNNAIYVCVLKCVNHFLLKK